MTTPSESALAIEFADEVRTLAAGDRITFGRQADLVIDERNRLLHRVLAEIVYTDSRWTLRNVGRTVSLVVTDLDGASFARIAPGSQVAVPFERTSVTFSAGRANYRLLLTQTLPDDRASIELPDDYSSADRTMTASTLAFNDEQFGLLVALARRRMDGPISSADLPTNRQLAHELGWTPAKLVRKLDHLCAKLHRAGISGLVGTSSLSASERRIRLADAAVEHGLVSRADIAD